MGENASYKQSVSGETLQGKPCFCWEVQRPLWKAVAFKLVFFFSLLLKWSLPQSPRCKTKCGAAQVKLGWDLSSPSRAPVLDRPAGVAQWPREQNCQNCWRGEKCSA